MPERLLTLIVDDAVFIVTLKHPERHPRLKGTLRSAVESAIRAGAHCGWLDTTSGHQLDWWPED